MKIRLLFFLCFVFSVAGVSASSSESGLRVTNEVAYETEYVHRGRKLGQKIFATSTTASYPLADGTVYCGLKTRFEQENAYTSGYIIENVLKTQFEASFNTIVPYIAYERKLSDTFSAMVGYFHYYYPNIKELNDSFCRASKNYAQNAGLNFSLNPGLKNHANEIMFGIWANVIFRPTIFMFYNFDFDEFVAVGHLFAKYDLKNIGLHKAFILADAYFGFDHANRPYGITFKNVFWYNNPIWKTINGHKGYVYAGAKLHLIYKLNKFSRIRTGINFETNGNNGMSWTNFTGWGSHKGVKQMLWYTLSAEIQF